MRGINLSNSRINNPLDWFYTSKFLTRFQTKVATQLHIGFTLRLDQVWGPSEAWPSLVICEPQRRIWRLPHSHYLESVLSMSSWFILFIYITICCSWCNCGIHNISQGFETTATHHFGQLKSWQIPNLLLIKPQLLLLEPYCSPYMYIFHANSLSLSAKHQVSSVQKPG